MKKILLLILFIALSTYSLIYFYSEIDAHNATIGLYLFFNVPLAALQLLLSIYLFTRKIIWLQIISVIGMIIAGLTLIPPTVLYLVF